ncbi:hypothetical protein ACFPRL_18105 [Pseudoclavibacter helvolus]
MSAASSGASSKASSTPPRSLTSSEDGTPPHERGRDHTQRRGAARHNTTHREGPDSSRVSCRR